MRDMARKMYLLIGMFAFSIVIVIALSWVGMSKLGQLQNEGFARGEDSVHTTAAAAIGAELYQVVADSIINGNLAESAKDWQKGKEAAAVKLAEVERSVDTDEEKRLALAAHQAYDDFINIYEKEMLPLLHTEPKNPAAITAVDDKIDEASLRISDSLDKIQKSIEKESKEADTEFDSVAGTTITTLLVIGGAILIAAMLFGLGIARNVLHQLGGDPRDVAQVVNTMASGNFSMHTGQVPAEGSLLANAYQMQASLRGMISTVKDQAHQVEDMASALAVAARQIAENVNHESDSVSSMASAIEEMSVSTAHISDQGGNARQIADASRNSAEAGAQVVNKTVSGLLLTAREIETASGEVSRLGEDATRIIDVVKVIKDIADQTNLLALNAAIEAARAGEQGRGFAVVADEVRKLAERTGNATNEINQMSGKISEVANRALTSMDKVVETTRQGVTDAETAQSSISGIQHSFSEVANVIEDISAALAEQNVASNDLAKNTERVAQMSEENSSAAQSLLSLAHDLENKAAEVKSAVGAFRV
ncbi:MAG: methyl-accepting chemotaxis protein [Nitrosomonadales bacterium]|nr:methyl-accepting chemotaxis protein [Nitrosomonadales bacterium]